MTEFLLIRHGANDYTKSHRLAGWLPGVHLNEHGREQAAAVGQRLAKTKIDAIYASPLERTVETAEAILVHHPGLTLHLLEDLGEIHFGDWQGKELGVLAQRKLWQVVQFAPSRMQFPNGETFRAAQQRAIAALEALHVQHPHQTVAIVSHSDLLKLIIAHYLGMHLDLFQRIDVATASLSILSFSSQFVAVRQLNETSYLPTEKPPTPENAAPETKAEAMNGAAKP